MTSRAREQELEPTVLIQQSIEQLERLSGMLADEILSERREALPQHKRISKEALLTISVLLPKLREARNAHARLARSVAQPIAGEH